MKVEWHKYPDEKPKPDKAHWIYCPHNTGATIWITLQYDPDEWNDLGALAWATIPTPQPPDEPTSQPNEAHI